MIDSLKIALTSKNLKTFKNIDIQILNPGRAIECKSPPQVACYNDNTNCKTGNTESLSVKLKCCLVLFIIS